MKIAIEGLTSVWIPQWAISSQAPKSLWDMEKVQRSTAYHGVGTSVPKWETPYLTWKGEDMIWST